MTGVIYARYSSDNQREESIEGQIRENTAFAEKNGNIYRYYKCASAKRHECDKKAVSKRNRHSTRVSVSFSRRLAEIAPLASAKQVPRSYDFAYFARQSKREYEFERLLPSFRVGSLAVRSKFPYLELV